jgi:hypothetical protein
MTTKGKRYPAEVRERAVRLVLEHRGEYQTEWAAITSIAAFWEAETSPSERHRLLTTPFEQVWQDDGTILAVKPRGACVPYFQAATQTHQSRSGSSGVQSGSDGGLSRTLPPDDDEIEVWAEPPQAPGS